MVNRTGLQVDGLREVAAALSAMGLEVEDPRNAMAQVAVEGAAAVAANAPRLSGALAANATPSTSKARAVVTMTLPYAGVQNYGWPRRNIVATGFLQAGDAQVRPRALQLLEQDINDKIRREGLA